MRKSLYTATKIALSFGLLLSTTSAFLPFPASAYSADTLYGLVSDSITNLPLGGVKVKSVAKSCSTVTGPTGTFTLAIPIPTSTFQPSVVRKKIRMADDVSMLDLKGRIIGNESGHASRIQLVRAKLSEGEMASRVLSLGSGRQSGRFCSRNSEVVGQVLAKSAANSYSLSFEKNGYSPVSRTASVGQSVVVKLVAERANGRSYRISPKGDDNLPDTSYGPFRTLAKVKRVLVAQGRTDGSAVVYIEAGTYPAQGLPKARIYGVAAGYDRNLVVLDGQLAGSDMSLTISGSVLHNLTIQNLRLDKFWAQSAVTVVAKTEIQNIAIRGCKVVGLGIRTDNVKLNKVLLENNLKGLSVGNWQAPQHKPGIDASKYDPVVNVQILNTVIRNNNLGVVDPKWAGQEWTYKDSQGKWHVYPKWVGGGGKVSFTDSVVFDNCDFYGNLGPGMWFDATNRNLTVINSRSYDNKSGGPDNDGGIGLAIEISYGPGLVKNNRFYNNSEAGVSIWESNDITVTQNSFGWNGTPIRLRAINRPDQNIPGLPPYSLSGTRLSGNAFDPRPNHDYVWHETRNVVVTPSMSAQMLRSLGVESFTW